MLALALKPAGQINKYSFLKLLTKKYIFHMEKINTLKERRIQIQQNVLFLLPTDNHC